VAPDDAGYYRRISFNRRDVLSLTAAAAAAAFWGSTPLKAKLRCLMSALHGGSWVHRADVAVDTFQRDATELL